MGALMVKDAEAYAAPASPRAPPLAVFEMRDLLAAVKAGTAPSMPRK